MKEKQLKIFGVVFIILLVLFLVTKPRQRGVNLDEFVQEILIGIAKEDIKGIEVYKQTIDEEPVRMAFSLQEDQWRISTHFGCKAQEYRMNRILDDFIEATGKVRSSDPKHFAKFEISDEQGLHLLFKDETDKTLANLILGKKGEDPNSGFVRFAGKEKVYYADKNLLSSLGIFGEIDTLTHFKIKSYIDLEAVKEDKEELEMVGLVAMGTERVVKKMEREIEVTKDDSTSTTKKENYWVLAKRNREIELDEKEVDKFLKDLTSIRAVEVIDRIGESLADLNKQGKYGFSRPSHYLVFKTPDGEQKNVIFGKKYDKDDGRYMHVQYEGLVYKINKSNFDKIFEWVVELPKKKKEKE